jgi:hypothetical protein
MQALLSLAEVANAQQLQRPFVDGIHTKLICTHGVSPKLESRQCFDAGTITTQAISPKAISRLKKRQSHPLGFFAWAVHTTNPFHDFKNSGLLTTSRVEQNSLLARHRHRSDRIVRQEAVGRSRHNYCD